ncbi:mRNA (guanine-N7-)-methyltransferase [Marchantia polymorpha subsp. ruderalis]|uniref:mRNA cap guanine-N(7) methyltransferase n=2 Tax=Marchantia polymorpha TaxID=3197 RepID=A0AAF6BPB4_MARPO|nr:hypothetical protein MARPO_0053s0007 [Marchantia polymorpha]BBN13848.1 hypothetical protein Mp_6g06920 [Marchantia polymorpha subsp. ruderalis]|eukprot:PTQ38050.1 hypothetical protein MARPO_0053s0007 [Marchantia polymorpha]
MSSRHGVKRDRDDSPPSSRSSRARTSMSEEPEDTKVTVRQVAEHYSNRSNQTREEREASPIIHLKKLNNWIKSVLIHLYANRGDAVLDLGCGKGGDLIKWDKASISYYVGVDVAEGSIEDARNRYNGDTDHAQNRKAFSFPARLVCADCFEVPLDEALKDLPSFDVCSCQFALHYSWSTEERARQTLHNVTTMLLPGGMFIGTMPDANVIVRKLRDADGLEFGNSVYKIEFGDLYSEKKFMSPPFGIQYNFHLEDAVDCPEWLVPFSKFVALAEEYGLELVMKQNFHEFVNQYIQKTEFGELMRKLGALGDGTEGNNISDDEWEAAYIYLAFVFRKKGTPKIRQRAVPKGSFKRIEPEDVLFVQ